MRRALPLAALAVLVAVPVATLTGQASGASPVPPTATTGSATSVSNTSETVTGTANPNGTQSYYTIQYGLTTAYGTQSPLVPASVGSGTTAVSESQTLTGLTPGTTYHFRILAFSSAGITAGADASFKTSGTAPAPATAPAATTGTASNVTTKNATLNGTVNPEGTATSSHFEYGTTTDYGYSTTPTAAGTGSTAAPAIANVTGLTPGTTYHYRLVAVSSAGTTLGADQTFQTLTPPTLAKLRLFGHTAFVAPHGVGGIFVGSIGPTSSTGSLKLERNGVTLGARARFYVAANNGGIVHFSLSRLGQHLLNTSHRLRVRVTVAQNGGNVASAVVTLVRFF
jgi:hypothetical protein